MSEIKILYEAGEDIYCYLDETNKVNSLIVTTFYPGAGMSKFYEIVEQCVSKYPPVDVLYVPAGQTVGLSVPTSQ